MRNYKIMKIALICALVASTLLFCSCGSTPSVSTEGETEQTEAPETEKQTEDTAEDTVKDTAKDTVKTDAPKEPDCSYLYFQMHVNNSGYTVELLDKNDFPSVVEIPAVYKGLPVVAITTEAFRDCEGLTEVSIPGSVKYIGRRAFYGCKSLTKLTMAEGVSEIGESAFENCTALREVKCPDSIEFLRSQAFGGCTALKEFAFPRRIQETGGAVLRGCSALEGVTMPSSGLLTISRETFRGCRALREVKIPNGVVTIGQSAFDGCESLESISIPDSVRLIEWFAFDSCISLKSVGMPRTLSFLGNSTFSGCRALTKLDLPAGIESVGQNCFRDCVSLVSIKIPDTCTTIGDSAFLGCKSLESVTLPQRLSKIESDTFSECTSLRAITIPSTVSLIGDRAFLKSGIESIVIPKSVKLIENYAFNGCASLAHVSIEKGVGELSSGLFGACYSLGEIKYLGNKADWDKIKKQSDWIGGIDINVICSDNSVVSHNYQSTGQYAPVLLGELQYKDEDTGKMTYLARGVGGGRYCSYYYMGELKAVFLTSSTGDVLLLYKSGDIFCGKKYSYRGMSAVYDNSTFSRVVRDYDEKLGVDVVDERVIRLTCSDGKLYEDELYGTRQYENGKTVYYMDGKECTKSQYENMRSVWQGNEVRWHSLIDN